MFFSRLKSFTRDYFTLTSRERRGALVLAFIIVIQVTILIWMNFLKSPELPEIEVYQDEINAFLSENSADKTRTPENTTEKNVPVELFPFDPNNASDTDFSKLGLSEKQISVIRNYLHKGGQFRTPENFSKMYCISADEYERLKPYITILQKKSVPETTYASGKPFAKKKSEIIELNSADTLKLQELPMIGAGRARMIYRYREKLGGFYSVEQLREVFTIDSTVYAAILPLVKVDASGIRKWTINRDSLSHPYISKKQAAILNAYRKQHGNFKDISDLQKATFPGDQFPFKIAPYVTFE